MCKPFVGMVPSHSSTKPGPTSNNFSPVRARFNSQRQLRRFSVYPSFTSLNLNHFYSNQDKKIEKSWLYTTIKAMISDLDLDALKLWPLKLSRFLLNICLTAIATIGYHLSYGQALSQTVLLPLRILVFRLHCLLTSIKKRMLNFTAQPCFFVVLFCSAE